MKRRILYLLRWCWRVLFLAVAFGVFVAAWYGYHRITAKPVRLVRNPGFEKEETEPENYVRIAAYNIAHGRGNGPVDNWNRDSSEEEAQRLGRIAEAIAVTNADVVVLNECDFDCTWSQRINQAEIIARQAGFSYRCEQPNFDVSLPFRRWRFGNCILSRWPIRDPERVSYPPLSEKENLLVGNHNGLLATIQHPAGSFRIVAVHLEVRSEDIRAGAARVLTDLMATPGPPLLLAGDFNSTPAGFPAHMLSAEGTNAMDLLLAPGRFQMFPGITRSPSHPHFTFPSANPQRIIDWILAPEEHPVFDLRVDCLPWSDHCLVSASVRLSD